MRCPRGALAGAILLVARFAVAGPAPSSAPPSGSAPARPPAVASSAAKPAAAKPPPPPKPAAKKPAPPASAAAADRADKGGPPAPRSVLAPNTSIRRSIAGGPIGDELAAGLDSPELRALRDAELELFPGAAPTGRSPWPNDLPTPPKGPLAWGGNGGLPPAPSAPPPAPAAVGGASLAWLADLQMPDIPVRWDTHVVRYLEFFKDDPRGRRIFTTWWRRSGRYRALVADVLRARSIPEDLLWVAVVESGLDPLARSHAGAAGLWQFMPDTAKVYGLATDRWADFRQSPLRATEAAASFLSDLKRRFGTWEMALAGYNMGYGGALASVRRFNSNDFWELSRLENALPWETSLYVPKIIAIAVVARNPQVFGYDTVARDAPLYGDRVELPSGTELKAVAALAGCGVKELEALNPELRAGRTPPTASGMGGGGGVGADEPTYVILVPAGKAAAVRAGAAKLAPKGSALERYVVRFGESLEQIAAARKTTKAKLVDLNGIAKGESVRGGTVLLVPALPAGEAPSAGGAFASRGATSVASADARPVVVVPAATFAYTDRVRVFYRVRLGDTPREIADAFAVSVDELRTWNAIEPAARLQEGMTLQMFVPKAADLSQVVALRDGEARVVAVGSDAFYAYEEAQRGRRRTTVHAKGGETLEAVGKRYGLSAGSMERINRRPRSDTLKPGEAVIVYLETSRPGGPDARKPAPPAPAEGDLPATLATHGRESERTAAD